MHYPTEKEGRLFYLNTTAEMLKRFILEADIRSLGKPGIVAQKKVLFESMQKNLESVDQPKLSGSFAFDKPEQWGRSLTDIGKCTSKFFKTNIPDARVVEKPQESPTGPNLKKA